MFPIMSMWKLHVQKTADRFLVQADQGDGQRRTCWGDNLEMATARAVGVKDAKFRTDGDRAAIEQTIASDAGITIGVCANQIVAI